MMKIQSGAAAGSSPSKPKLSHPPPWALDGEPPALHYSIKWDVPSGWKERCLQSCLNIWYFLYSL